MIHLAWSIRNVNMGIEPANLEMVLVPELPAKAPTFFGPDLVPNGWQKLSVKDTSR